MPVQFVPGKMLGLSGRKLGAVALKFGSLVEVDGWMSGRKSGGDRDGELLSQRDESIGGNHNG